MRLMPAIVIGFVSATMTAVIIGFCIGMLFTLADSSPEAYAAELVGVVISMTVFYFLVLGSYRRQKRKDVHYAERLA